MNTLFALLKRELLEHKSILRVPLVLLGIALLVRFSLSFGDLALDVNVPEQLNLDETINTVMSGVIGKALNIMNYLIMVVMFLVAAFYALASLFNERQDQSVLFWRSLPISDSMTIGSKLLIALLVVPVLILVCQAIVAVFFLGLDSSEFLLTYYSYSLPSLGIMLLWSLLPIVCWCLFCSQFAKKNPFLFAFVTPILVIIVDYLFFNGWLSKTIVINRISVEKFTGTSMVIGIVFSMACITATILKRSQRI